MLEIEELTDIVDREEEAARAAAATRVLLIEDDPISLRILKKRIGNAGYQIESAVDGVEGLEKFETFRPHLVISDWMMPRMDGRELCQAIKERAPGESVYFILLTARDKHEDIVRALDTGADEYLIKPCDGPELMARLRAATRLVQLQNELRHSNERLREANQRINQELQAVSSIQRNLLPQVLPEIPGYRFAAHYQPSSECSGDFYDVHKFDDGRFAVIMGDVSGHGAPAMVTMAMVRMLYRMQASEERSPAEMMSLLNRRMFEHLPTDQYATMFYGVVDAERGRLTYSSSGHPPPLIYRRDGSEVRHLPRCEGYPIKLVAPDVAYEDFTVDLQRGESLVLYTDGATECFDEEARCYGPKRLRSAGGGGRGCEPMRRSGGCWRI